MVRKGITGVVAKRARPRVLRYLGVGTVALRSGRLGFDGRIEWQNHSRIVRALSRTAGTTGTAGTAGIPAVAQQEGRNARRDSEPVFHRGTRYVRAFIEVS